MSRKKIPTKQLLESVRDLADELGRPPTSTEYQDKGRHTFRTLYMRFGSWQDVIQAAGYDYDDVYGRGEKRRRRGLAYLCYACGHEFRSSAEGYRTQCNQCSAQVVRWRARVAYAGTIDAIRTLATDGPIVGEPVSGDPDSIQRDIVHVIRPPKANRVGNSYADQHAVQQVLYLPGQERAAMTAFIEANEAYIRDVLGATADHLRQAWSDEMYQLLIEQWHWTGRGTVASDRITDD